MYICTIQYYAIHVLKVIIFTLISSTKMGWTTLGRSSLVWYTIMQINVYYANGGSAPTKIPTPKPRH